MIRTTTREKNLGTSLDSHKMSRPMMVWRAFCLRGMYSPMPFAKSISIDFQHLILSKSKVARNSSISISKIKSLTNPNISKPASPKVNHSKTYKRTAEQTSNITISKWVEETTQLLLAQRTRLHFALNNAASSLGRQFSVEEVRSMQSAWHNVERAVTGLEIEAVRQEMM